MKRGAKGMYTVAVIGILGVLAMMMMYGYTAEKLLPESDAAAKKTVDLLAHAFGVQASGRVEGGVFRLTYIAPAPAADAAAKAEMEKAAAFVETNFPEPLAAIEVTREVRGGGGCSAGVSRSELRVVPKKRGPGR